MTEFYEIYTDGSYKNSTDCGGYSAIITQNGEIITKLYQGYESTTNNRQEMMGVLKALQYFKTPVKMLIYSDSAYVVNSIMQGHVYRWFREKDYSKKNLDLWYEIIELLDFHDVELLWVKGHNKNKFNEMADLYAQHGAQCMNLERDLGYSKIPQTKWLYDSKTDS